MVTKRGRVFSRWVVFPLVLALVFSFAIQFSVQSAQAATLGITQVQQANPKWCWAASAQMVGRWRTPTVSSRTQWDAAYYIHGSYDDLPATASQTASASTYVSLGYVGFSKTGVFSSGNIQTMINSYNNPLIVGCLNYYDAGIAHMAVIHGVDGSGNLLICDPATGTSTYLTYATLTSYTYNETVYTYSSFSED